jgi:L-threonylcarbamoyladenylate synthase
LEYNPSDGSMKTDIVKVNQANAITHAVDVLQHGGLVAFPTDTVYGLAAIPFKEETVEGLFSAKGRNNSRAIAILVGDYEDLPKVVDHLDEKSTRLVQRFWPGPLTLVVPRSSRLPKNLSPDDSIGVRMPDHPIALALLRQIGPLAVTSANISGQDNANTADEVYQQLNGRVHLILDGGRTQGGVPSTVVNCMTPAMSILREGPISRKNIEKALL